MLTWLFFARSELLIFFNLQEHSVFHDELPIYVSFLQPQQGRGGLHTQAVELHAHVSNRAR